VSKKAFNFVRSIQSERWMITRAAANSHLPLVHAILTGNYKSYHDDSDDREREEVEDENTVRYAVHSSAGYELHSEKKLSKISAYNNEPVIAIIPYKAAVQKYGGWCAMGTEELAERIKVEADNPRVSAIILDMDSPGGAGDAVAHPSAAINYAKERKPVVGYAGNGMTASAAYWIMSHTHEIYATYETDEIGSIGTYITLVNYEQFLSNYYNADVHQVYASASTAEKSSTDWLLEKELDPFNDIFIKTVRENRPNINEDVFKGRLYMAKDALEMGLIDGMMSFEEVLNRASELSENFNSKSTNTMFGKNKKVNALIGASERTPEMFTEANEELASVNLQIVSTEEITALRSNQVDKEKESTHNTFVTSIATALGLKTNEQGEITNEAGEAVDVSAHITDLNSQLNALSTENADLKKKAQPITTSITGAASEGPTESKDAPEVAAMYAGIEEKLNNY
jgi:protease-4